jgi:putative membrane protein
MTPAGGKTRGAAPRWHENHQGGRCHLYQRPGGFMADNVSALAVVPTPDPSMLNDQDTAFLQQAQLSNLAEVAESNVALQNTSNIASRDFAHWMIGDHSGQAAQLSSIAQQLGVTLPTALDPQHQAEVSQLSSLSDGAFDQAYAQSGVQDHAQAIALFQQEAQSGENPALVALANQSLPLLQAHFEQASILAGQPDPGPVVPPPPSAGGSGGAALSTQDQAFVDQAATSSLAEIAEGQIAIQRGNLATSEFGRWMTADHGAMNTALGAIAQSEGFSLPTTVTPEQQSDLDALQNNSDGTFDSVYATNQVVDHVKVLMTFVREATTGTDPALVAFAKSGLPVLEQHLYGAAELKLDSLGIAPPTGSLSSLLQNGIAAAGTQGSLLTDAIFPSLIQHNSDLFSSGQSPQGAYPNDMQMSQMMMPMPT